MDENALIGAIGLSRSFETNEGHTPFGAVVAMGEEIIGRGVSTVVASKDPTAHAEVNAIREASAFINNHELTGAVMYCSAFPCPLCLMACAWAGITTVYYGAELSDSSSCGFEDLDLYNSLMQGPRGLGIELVGAGGEHRRSAVQVIREWKVAFENGNWNQ